MFSERALLVLLKEYWLQIGLFLPLCGNGLQAVIFRTVSDSPFLLTILLLSLPGCSSVLKLIR